MAKLLNESSGMPQMNAAFAGWFTTIELITVRQTVENGLVTKEEEPVTFKGTIQPLSPKEIALKPEGQRAWTWLQIHAIAGELNLNVNDRIRYNGTDYKIMALKDYSLNNYIEYHAVKDYEAAL